MLYSKGVGGDTVFQFKPKRLSEDTRIAKLKTVLDLCAPDALDTKQFKGLLHDYIPHETGYKARLALLGQSGTLQKVIRLKDKKKHQQDKIEKLAKEFSNTYGFHYPIVLETLTDVAKALEIPAPERAEETAQATREIVSGVSSGNFSKKHLDVPTGNVTAEGQSVQIKAKGQPPLRKKAPKRQKWALPMLLVYLLMTIGGYIAQVTYFKDTAVAQEVVTRLWAASFRHPLVIAGSVGLILMLVLPPLLHRKKKMNLTTVYPVLIILIELVAAALYVAAPLQYEMVQILIGSLLSVSFLLLLIPIFLSNQTPSATLSRKVVVPYVLTTATWIGAQVLIRYFL